MEENINPYFSKVSCRMLNVVEKSCSAGNGELRKLSKCLYSSVFQSFKYAHCDSQKGDTLRLIFQSFSCWKSLAKTLLEHTLGNAVLENG
jgi:hypothetical protein